MSGFFGGAPALSWSIPNPDTTAKERWLDNEALRGVPLGGKVIAIGEPEQQTEMGTGKPRWWQEPDEAKGIKGRPKMEIAVTLRCDGTGGGRDLRNPQNPTDLGDRRLYVPDFGDLNKAIKAAFTKAGAPDLLVNGTLLVAWLGYRESKVKGGHPARTFAADYKMPPTGLAVGDQGVSQPPAGSGNPFDRAQQAHPTDQAGVVPPASYQPAAQQQPAPVGNPFGGPSQVQQQQAAPAGSAPNPFA